VLALLFVELRATGETRQWALRLRGFDEVFHGFDEVRQRVEGWASIAFGRPTPREEREVAAGGGASRARPPEPQSSARTRPVAPATTESEATRHEELNWKDRRELDRLVEQSTRE